MKHYFYICLTTVFLISCENLIEGPEDLNNPSGNTVKTTLTSIQNELFTKSCPLSGCHGGTQKPNLTAGQSYGNLVNVASIGNASLMRVKPFESDNSYLIRKLRGQGTSVMPPSGQLKAAIIDSVVAWIDKGALNN